MNLDKYINNTTQTSEGVIYKNEDAFYNKVGICHIGEYLLEMLTDKAQSGEDMTDEEIVSCGAGDTYSTIIKQVTARWNEFDDEVQNECTIEQVAENVFHNALWTCISTEIDQMTY